MMITMSFAKNLSSMSLKQLERYEDDLRDFKRMLKESLVELEEERSKVSERIDEEYAK